VQRRMCGGGIPAGLVLLNMTNPTLQSMNEGVLYEPLIQRRECESLAPAVNRAGINHLIGRALQRIERSLPGFIDVFPAPSSHGGIYSAIPNVEWTNGFWTGMLWLAWEISGEPHFRATAERQTRSFLARVASRDHTDHHDLGFLYTLSTCAGYGLTGDEAFRAAGIAAAELLFERFSPIAEIIQAWGDLRDPEQRGRMIIDCNLNLPLLWWATTQTGDARFGDAANRHVAQAARYLVRSDASTFHTYYMDTLTGAPRYGSTHQGYSDDSCWARGQAWGIYGFALAFRHTGDASYLEIAAKLANYFLNRLPGDFICCWDLVFTDEATLRDSSAAAIAACGLLDIASALPLAHPDRAAYEAAATHIVEALDRAYLASLDGSNGLLTHAVYNLPRGIGIDESCIWGDYFYLEALMRLHRPWGAYLEPPPYKNNPTPPKTS